MPKIQFSERAWDEYLYWQTEDKKTLKRINRLLKEISREGRPGIGKAEFLKGDLSGLSSVRIDDTNRLVYEVEGDVVRVHQCRGHYI